MHRRLAWSIPALAAVLVLARPAAAQTPPPAGAPHAAAPAATAPVSASQAAAANELFKSLNMQAQIASTSAAMIDSEIGHNPGMQPYRDVMIAWLQKYMTWEAMKPELIRIYTEAYTEAELKELAAFYKTTAGQKSLAKTPELMQKTAMAGAKLGQPHTDELKKLMDARREDLAKQQEKAAGAAQAPAPAKKPTAAPKKP